MGSRSANTEANSRGRLAAPARFLGVPDPLAGRLLGVVQAAGVAHHRILAQLVERGPIPGEFSVDLGVALLVLGNRLLRGRMLAAGLGQCAAGVVKFGLSLAQHPRLPACLDAGIDGVSPVELRHRIAQSLVLGERVAVFVQLGHRFGDIFQRGLRYGRKRLGQGLGQVLLVGTPGKLWLT